MRIGRCCWGGGVEKRTRDPYAITAFVRTTPHQPHPYAAVICRGDVLMRSKPVATLGEAERVLLRLLAEATEQEGYA
ncbi:MAG: hypothetical protein JWO33_2558 [Caulobacteraceae bacterium]|nr:hypothetical protein [Caulobacteraceae bacterium]